ncbi:hypothetical protein HYU94_02340 [Candidatus Daviesbacteria bacterium]|nr:hypothetical protein [Candidatus Daviesbacteria bacterium]
MTAENKPSFKTGAVELVKALGLLAQMALDPRTDVAFMRQWNTSPDKPETFAGKIRKTLSIIRSK